MGRLGNDVVNSHDDALDICIGKKMVLNSTLISTAQTLAPDSSKNPYCANPGFKFDNKAEEFWLHFLFRNGGAWSQAVHVFFSCCFKQ